MLAAILSLSHGAIRRERGYLEEIAEDVTTVVETEDAHILFEGPAARQATALLLVAIAAHESGFSHEIDRCEKRGDGGRSRSMWQLIGSVHLEGHSFEEVCENRRLAARLALHALAESRERDPFATTQRLLNAYAGGSWLHETRASRGICSMWQTRAARFGLVGAYCHKRAPIRLRDEPKDAERRAPLAPAG